MLWLLKMSCRVQLYYSGHMMLNNGLLVMSGMLLYSLHMLGTNYLSFTMVWFAVCGMVMCLHLWHLTMKYYAVTY